jgi:hypothetical protein
MTKIVYNDCYGGFGLSKKAIERYCELSGLGATFVEDEYSGYWELPNGDYWYHSNLSRDDPFLVQVVEELGKEANNHNRYSNLQIVELPAGTLYRIEEYDGMEKVMRQDQYKWKVA